MWYGNVRGLLSKGILNAMWKQETVCAIRLQQILIFCVLVDMHMIYNFYCKFFISYDHYSSLLVWKYLRIKKYISS